MAYLVSFGINDVKTIGGKFSVLKKSEFLGTLNNISKHLF